MLWTGQAGDAFQVNVWILKPESNALPPQPWVQIMDLIGEPKPPSPSWDMGIN